MNKVKVTADEFGNVIRVSKNNPEYGFVRLEQSVVEIHNGWVRRKGKTAILPGLVSDLKYLAWEEGEELEGKIVVKETLEPIIKDNPDYGVKRAGQDGPICVFEDQPIYRRTYFTMDMDDEDIYIQHTNVDEIRENNAKSVESVKAAAKVAETKTTPVAMEVEEPATDEVAFDF